MKKLIAFAAMLIAPITHAEELITCSDRYETLLSMDRANLICEFGSGIRDSIARFNSDTTQRCGSYMSPQTRSDISNNASLKIDKALKKYGKDTLCARVANAIYKSDPVAKNTNKSSDDDVMLVMASKQPIDGIIKNSDMLFMLDTKVSCPFPVSGWERMHIAFIFNRSLKKPVPGCWALTNDPSGAEAFIIGKDGSVLPSINMMNLQRVMVLDNGDGKIIGPAMTYEQYQKNITDYKKQFN
ncbi:hypothetical protein [Burkholderia cenocepacia]|uniref:hypothetical protein n=1 Tax=Burkholderia cenocepacia TaxID=95486 RepID=UPI002ABE616C|nr:hypothetical protein [Burkholderia cenocepacia]